MASKKLPTLAQAEAAIGEPASKWVARCYEIACAIVEAKIVPVGSVAVYGHWLGPIAPGTHFYGRAAMAFCQHGWVLLPDGRVLDPTRWVFEGAEPYLYVGLPDHYDEGGNKLREAMNGSPPRWEPDDKQYDFDKRVLPSTEAWKFIEQLFQLERYFTDDRYQPGMLSRRQLSWLANLSPQKLGEHALPIYRAICKLDQSALIPIDNMRRVEREHHVEIER